MLHTGIGATHHPHVHIIIVPGGGRRRRRTLDRLQARLLSAVGCPVALLPSPLPGRLARLREGGSADLFGDPPGCQPRCVQRSVSRRCAAPNGSSTPSARSAALRPSRHICRATPTASPSQTAASSHSDGHRASFRWKDYRVSGERAGVWIKHHDAARRRVHAPLPVASFSPMVSTASAITVSPRRARQERRAHQTDDCRRQWRTAGPTERRRAACRTGRSGCRR